MGVGLYALLHKTNTSQELISSSWGKNWDFWESKVGL